MLHVRVTSCVQLSKIAPYKFQTAKNKNTKQRNQKANINKTAFCVVEFLVFMTFWGLYNLTPQR